MGTSNYSHSLAPVNFGIKRLVTQADSFPAASATVKVEIFVMFRLIGNRVINPIEHPRGSDLLGWYL